MEYNKQELKVGTYVELEHYGKTRDLKKSMVIAKQHLTEDPTYYSKLYQAGLIDEPKAIELAKKYFTDKPQYYTENILSEIQDIIREYEWGEPEGYEYGQDSDWWSKQIAGESIDVTNQETSNIIVCDNCGWSWELSDGGNDPYDCHKCNNKNNKVHNELEE